MLLESWVAGWLRPRDAPERSKEVKRGYNKPVMREARDD